MNRRTLIKIGLFHFFMCISLSYLPGQMLPSGFQMNKILSELNPSSMAIDPLERVWIVEKHGRVSIMENEQILEQPFIEIDVDDFNERGLLGLAFHPNYSANGYVYLFYTVPDKNRNRVIRVKSNGDTAIPGSEEEIIELDSLYGSIHNAGAMVFDDEGYLFIATGEGGRSPDAQDLNNLNGKILRLHDDGSIPEDNPYFDLNEGIYKTIYSYGLRNPFSMTYDHHTDQIIVSDVGQGTAEEINIIEPGKNYGWPLFEGYASGNLPIDYMDPYYAYSHDEGCAIIGAAVLNRGHGLFPEEYQDALYFSDYCEGFLKYVLLDGSITVRDFGISPERPLAIHFTESGKMYLLTRSGIGGGSTGDNTITNDGALWEIEYTGSGAPNIISQSNDQKIAKGEDASFYVKALGDIPFDYSWMVNGQLDTTNVSDTYIFEDVNLGHDGTTLQCIVSDSMGHDTSDVMTLFVLDDERPQPIIILPFDDILYKAGDTIHFLGRAIDGGSIMPDSSLVWKVDQHHNEHSHPVIGNLCCTSSGSLVIPNNGETSPNVWIRITLIATDSVGLSASTYLDIQPDLTFLNIHGKKDAIVNVDGTYYNLPVKIPSLKGIERVMTVPNHQIIDDSIYLFKSWENGSNVPLRSLITPLVESNYEINFSSAILGNGNGLLGEYFNDPEFDLDGTPDFVRTDTIIQFNWGSGSPSSEIDKDKYTIRWTGYIQPIFSETYTFYTFSDDGARLYINDSLIIDEWHTQSAREHTGEINLSAGEKYRIRLEYLESSGGSLIEFRWSGESTPKQIVPKRQLYLAAPPGTIAGETYIDLNKNGFFDLNEEGIENVPIVLYASDNSIRDFVYSDETGYFEIDQVDSGYYFLHFNIPLVDDNYQALAIVDHLGFTPEFRLNPSQYKFLSIPYDLISNVDQLNKSDSIVIAPNPFRNSFRVITERKIKSINIYDELYQKHFSYSGSDKDVNVNLTSGVYWIQVITDNGVFIKKMICVN